MVQASPLWERLVAVGIVLAVALLTWIAARAVGRRMRGKTRFGLHALDRLAGPLSLLAAVGSAAGITIWVPGPTPPLLEALLQVLGITAAFWLAARAIDVLWATGRQSARLRGQPGAGAVLLVGHHIGKVVVVIGLLAALAVRFGATEQLYLFLTAVAAAATFAARDPLRNAVAFASMVLDPPFRMGDHVRITDFRGGEITDGEVVAISLTGVTVQTRQRTHVVIANVEVLRLRIENLSAADRRRLELAVPISSELPAGFVRAACERIEADLRESPYTSGERPPRVWLSGAGGVPQIKASLWLRRGTNRREAQHALLLAFRERLEPPRKKPRARELLPEPA